MAFVYQLPSYGSGIWKAITGGFETSGGVFHQSGLPYSVTQSLTSVAGGGSTFANGSVLLLAHQLNNNFDHHCGGGSHALLPDGTAPNQCNFVNSFAPPTSFTQQSRNSLIGPAYTDMNFGAFKTIGIPHSEVMKLKLGAQFFNLFNHPNFQNPSHTSDVEQRTVRSVRSRARSELLPASLVRRAAAMPPLVSSSCTERSCSNQSKEKQKGGELIRVRRL